jgi:Tfp pilus assembly protein PilF
VATSTLPLTLDFEGARSVNPGHSILPFASGGLSTEAKNCFREGMELLGIGEAQRAIARLEKTVACAPEYSDGYVGLGIAYAMASHVYPALDSFERAAELDPANFYAHFKLAQLYFKLRVPQKGYEEAERALRCASTPVEKSLLAQILREERQREAGGVARPTWNKPFPRIWLRTGLALLAATCLLLITYVK